MMQCKFLGLTVILRAKCEIPSESKPLLYNSLGQANGAYRSLSLIKSKLMKRYIEASIDYLLLFQKLLDSFDTRCYCLYHVQLPYRYTQSRQYAMVRIIDHSTSKNPIVRRMTYDVREGRADRPPTSQDSVVLTVLITHDMKSFHWGSMPSS